MRDHKRDTDVKNRLLDSVGEGEGGMIWENSTETCIFHLHMWNRSPVQFQRMRQGAQGWCIGGTLRDGMRREVGRGFRMGNLCTPMADSCQWCQKPLQYCKVISLQLNNFFLNPNTIKNKKIQWDEDSWVWHWGHCWPWWDQGWWAGEDSICLEEVWENRWRWSRDFGRSRLLKLSYVSRTVWPQLCQKQHPNQKQWDAQCKETKSLRDGTGQGGSALGRSRPAVFQRQCILCLRRPQTCQPQLFSALAQLMLCRGGRKSFSALSRSLLLHSKIQLKKISKRRKTYTIYQIFMHKEHLSRMKIKKIKKKRNNED